MKKIRIYKDFSISWEILTNGLPQPLEGRNLTLEIIYQNKAEEIPFTTEGNVINLIYNGINHKGLGVYSLTLWENKGVKGQTVVDKVKAFELVANTDLEENDRCTCN